MRGRFPAVGIMVIFMWAVVGMGVAMAQNPIALVEAQWLNNNLKNSDIRIVDVSNKADTFAKGHIPGAVPVRRYADLAANMPPAPNLYPNQEQFEQLMSRLGITPNTTVVAYDDSPGFFASRLLLIMELYGHDTGKLKLLNGGSKYWQSQGLPMSTTPVPVKATTYKAAKNHFAERTLTWDQILRDVLQGGKPEVVLLDVRPAAEYGAENIRSIRGGHIPKAINVTGGNAVGPDMRFKSLEEMRKMFTDAGITPDKTIYEYCHSGDRSAHAYIILHHLLGYKNVKSYPGSWEEWSSLTFLPAGGQVWLWEAPKK
jgi:thiosulfate/3-mercaptopyruvate sulfurtransferase